MKILVINGPNLNFLGIREPKIYGLSTYKDLKKFIKNVSKQLKIKTVVVNSNYEGRIIYLIQQAHKKYDAIIINPGALTHYSYAIRDAIASINKKVVEVHLTDLNLREDFRKISVIKDVCVKSFMENHFESYAQALNYLSKDENVLQ